jgi:hypothetical protein
MKRIPVLLAVFLFASACGTATTASVSTSSPGSATKISPAAPAKPSTYNLPVGAMITMTASTSGDTWNVTVNSVKSFTSDNPYETPTAGYHFIVIDVTYEVTNGTADANPFDWEAKDPSGSVSPTGLASQTLPASTVEAPNKVGGTVVLEIETGSAGTVVYSAGFSERASWSFSVADVA